MTDTIETLLDLYEIEYTYSATGNLIRRTIYVASTSMVRATNVAYEWLHTKSHLENGEVIVVKRMDERILVEKL